MAQPHPPPLARERGSAQDCSQQEVVSTAHESGEARPQSLLSPSHSPPGPLFPKGWSARRVWQQPSWAAGDGPAGGGKAEEDLGRRTSTVAPAQGSWRWAADGTVCQSWASKCSASWEVGATLGPTGTAKETGRGSWAVKS